MASFIAWDVSRGIANAYQTQSLARAHPTACTFLLTLEDASGGLAGPGLIVRTPFATMTTDLYSTVRFSEAEGTLVRSDRPARVSIQTPNGLIWETEMVFQCHPGELVAVELTPPSFAFQSPSTVAPSLNGMLLGQITYYNLGEQP